MKKVCLSLMAMIAIVACTGEEVQPLSPPDAKSMQWGSVTRRSYGEAVAVAKRSIAMLEASGATTRSIGAPRTLNLRSGVRGICKAATRSANGTASNDTLLYVFNFNDAQGFAVVSASRQTEALIAVVENGSYEPVKYPKSLNLTYPGRDVNTTTLDWNSM